MVICLFNQIDLVLGKICPLVGPDVIEIDLTLGKIYVRVTLM